MTVSIEAAGANGFLRLHVIKRTYPTAAFAEDRDWLTADVTLTADGRSARLTDTVLQSGELAVWARQLESSNKILVLSSAEPIVELVIDRKAGTCLVQLDPVPGEKEPVRAVLKELDLQTLLQHIRAALLVYPPQKEEADEA
ncbi:WapI family immunity protein [Alkalicoccus luteus]|uniref:WapI family immunity protein n=1 Tax=Alkalicoccus luteus TaxID=1237094 RepID=UPI004033241E